MSDFVHLHNHTHFSLLDAACTPEQLIRAAVEDGQKSIALTDHGVMFGCSEFYHKAQKAGIKPILGCEVYLSTGSRHEKSRSNSDGSKKRNYHHLVLLAKNNIGYKNLMKLTTLGHTEGFYYKPRIDRELLVQYKEGLIATSACLAGVINAPLLEGKYDEAKANAIWFKEQFGDDFYIELQDHGMEEDRVVMELAPRIAAEVGVALIVSNDCHYIKKEHAIPHNVLLHIRDIGKEKVDINKLRYRVPEMYFKSRSEMKDLFKLYPDAIENTVAISEKCDVTLNSELQMPKFPIPPNSKAKTLDEYLEELTLEGLQFRFAKPSTEVLDRIKFELDVIKKMGYAGYFLIVWDFIRAARDLKIRVGPGRGSVAGSLVAFCLRITDIDPIKYDLLFERFLNPDRVSMPDIDVDFSDDKRAVVIKYVREKYGADSVTQIITFGTLQTKAVIKDVGRVLGVDLATVNSITSKIPVTLGKVKPLIEALELPDLKWLKDSADPQLQKLVEYSLVLEGLARNSSLHAAGVVIAPSDLTDYVPLYKSNDDQIATQYTMKELENNGLLKMDFLGLRTLSIIDKTLEWIKQNHGIELDMDAINFDDKRTWDMLSRGKTLGVFQFESQPMADALRKLKPSSIEDLTAMNALYRPGPMANIPEFIERKNGRKQVEYLHPAMKPALEKTYGIIVYQEQVMQLVRDIAGFTLAQSDVLRRAMGKKDAVTMEKQRAIFVEGALANGFEVSIAETIFELLKKFADYGFNKSHSVAYSYLAYQTAWLKANYPVEFYSANMTAELNNQEKIVELMNEAQKSDIKVLPPDINRSFAPFTATKDSIFFGLAAIKGVGIGAVEEIIAARSSDHFKSLFDFAGRVSAKVVNKKLLEALVCAGAFDSLQSGNRAQLFNAIDSATDYARASQVTDDESMDSLFGDDISAKPVEPSLPKVKPWSESERLEKEKACLGFYVSGHPLNAYAPFVNSLATHKLHQIGESKSESVRICGIITEIRTRLDRRENTVAFLKVEDFSGIAECIFWSDSYKKFASILHVDDVVVISGKCDTSNESAKIVVDDVMGLEDALLKYAKGLSLRLDLNSSTSDVLLKVKELLTNGQGTSTSIKLNHLKFVTVDSSADQQSMFVVNDLAYQLSYSHIGSLVQLLGRDNVRIELVSG